MAGVGKRKLGPFSALGSGGRFYREGVRLLYERCKGRCPAVTRGPNPTGVSHAASGALDQMASRLSLSPGETDPFRLLFSVQTFFALVVKVATISLLRRSGRFTERASDRGRRIAWSRAFFESLESQALFQEMGIESFPDASDYAWYLDGWDSRLAWWLMELSNAVESTAMIQSPLDPAGGGDLFGEFYQGLFPKQVRHALGEHYTPTWLADLVLDRVGFDGKDTQTILDPTCGSGVFLLRAMNRIRASGDSDDVAASFERVSGFDVNPLAVLSAGANCLLALRKELSTIGPVRTPVALRDVVLETPTEAPAFDCIVGNPPWLSWDHLSTSYRQATKRLWEQYGLFSLSGSEARHGGGKKDLAMLILYRAADQFLREGGRLGMVVTQTMFQTRGAGDGFRRFRIGSDGPRLRVLCVDDLVEVQPFSTASNWSATIALEKGNRTKYPVRYVRWKRGLEEISREPDRNRAFLREELVAEPIDAARLHSPWFVRPKGLGIGLERLVGPSDYEAHLGANTGGANGVYWVDIMERTDDCLIVQNHPGRGKRSVSSVRASWNPTCFIRWSAGRM